MPALRSTASIQRARPVCGWARSNAWLSCQQDGYSDTKGTMRLRVGCAMWTLKGWVGRSIPESTPTGGELAAYAAVVDAVEGNTTFYALPTPQSAQRWAEAVPDDFRFLFKLPKRITHDRRLRDAEDDLWEFLEATEPLRAKMGPVSIQLPAAFGPDGSSALDGFLRSASSEVEWSVEVRHPAFFEGEDERRLNDLLFGHGAERVILDSRAVFAGPCVTPAEREAFANKPRLPVRAVAIGLHPIVRFIGQTDPEANPAFWTPWVKTVARWLEDGREPTVFIHTPDNIAALDLARRFYDEVRETVPGLAALPEPPPVREQSLFDS